MRGIDRKRLRLLSPDPELLEQTEYHSRRLAKMGIPASEVLRSLLDLGYTERQVRDIALIVNSCYYEVREAEARVLEDLSRAELESRSLHEALRKFTRTLAEYAQADYAAIWYPQPVTGVLRRPRCFPCRPGDPRVLDPAWTEAVTCWSAPLGTEGVLQLGFRKPYPWLARERDLLIIAADRCRLAAERARLIEQLSESAAQIRQLSQRLLETEERERRRISREIHDDAGQALLCIRLNLEMLESQLVGHPEVAARLRDTRLLAERTVTEIRRILSALNPEVLERLGLGAAVRQLGQRFPESAARVVVDIGPLPELPEPLALLLYRLAQECLSNAVRHAEAKTIKISLQATDTDIRLKVTDNGKGFLIAEGLRKPGSFGLSGIRERVALFGGSVTIQSRLRTESQRHGTTVEISIPLGQINSHATDQNPVS